MKGFFKRLFALAAAVLLLVCETGCAMQAGEYTPAGAQENMSSGGQEDASAGGQETASSGRQENMSSGGQEAESAGAQEDMSVGRAMDISDADQVTRQNNFFESFFENNAFLNALDSFLFSGITALPKHTHEKTEKPVYKAGASCSIYIYMCGSNLESKYGIGSTDIGEILSANIPANVNVVIETGGTSCWQRYGIRNDRLQRYLVKNHALVLVDEKPNQSMGDANTFVDYVQWARRTYPAEREVLVIWDHGGNAMQGFCYDENYQYSALKHSALAKAMKKANLGKKMDMIIFDTCFMANIESADLFQEYFHYMIASEVVVPGGGLNYRTILGEFAGHDDETYGKLICDEFMDRYRKKNRQGNVELSLYDLGRTDYLLNELEIVFMYHIYVIRSLLKKNTETGSEYNFPSDYNTLANRCSTVEGNEACNVIDIYNYIYAAFGKKYLRWKKTKSLIKKLTIYQVGVVPNQSFNPADGEDLKNLCHGVSLYYPMKFNKEELKGYISICPVKKYAQLLDILFFHDEDCPLAFKSAGGINTQGNYEIKLTKASAECLESVECRVWRELKNGEYDLIGEEHFEVYDKKEQTFEYYFDGQWAYLGGYPLKTECQWTWTNRYLFSKIYLNGKPRVYSFKYQITNRPSAVAYTKGVVGGQYDENGLIDRVSTSLRTGDVVGIVTNSKTNRIKEFTVKSDTIRPERQMLPKGRYRLQFKVMDMSGHSISSNYAIFKVTKNGAKIVEVVPVK